MADVGGIPSFYSSVPTIKVKGQADAALGERVLSLLVEETIDGLYRCEFTVTNWGPTASGIDYLYFDKTLFDFGADIEVEMGAGEAKGTVFKGRVMAMEGRFPETSPPELTVLAEDQLQDLRMTRRTRSWEDVSDSDVMSAIISDHGLSANVSVKGPSQHKVLAQVNQSDLAFLRERARAVDAEVWIQDDKVNVQSRGDRKGGDLSLAYGGQLREFSALADLAGQRTAVTVTGWDVSAKAAISQEATDSAISAELGSLTAGSKLLKKLGDRKEQLVHTVPLTDDDAKYMAEATFRRIARRFVTGTALAEGDGRIRVGATVELTELGPLFSGKYYVVEARHLFDIEHGYRTHFRVERPGIGE